MPLATEEEEKEDSPALVVDENAVTEFVRELESKGRGRRSYTL